MKDDKKKKSYQKRVDSDGISKTTLIESNF